MKGHYPELPVTEKRPIGAADDIDSEVLRQKIQAMIAAFFAPSPDMVPFFIEEREKDSL